MFSPGPSLKSSVEYGLYGVCTNHRRAFTQWNCTLLEELTYGLRLVEGSIPVHFAWLCWPNFYYDFCVLYILTIGIRFITSHVNSYSFVNFSIPHNLNLMDHICWSIFLTGSCSEWGCTNFNMISPTCIYPVKWDKNPYWLLKFHSTYVADTVRPNDPSRTPCLSRTICINSAVHRAWYNSFHPRGTSRVLLQSPYRNCQPLIIIGTLAYSLFLWLLYFIFRLRCRRFFA